MAHDVFISHSAEDKATSDAICANLESSGIRCWIAPRDIIPGKDWGESIIDAINECSLMVLVFSFHSNNSRQVMREVERAVNRGASIIPFRIEDVTPSKSLEYFISAPHWLDAMTEPLEEHLARLNWTVKSLLSQHVDEGKVEYEVPTESRIKEKQLASSREISIPRQLMFEEGELINDQYEVLERLSGGMGHVYISLDQVTQKKLALKTLREELNENVESRARFEREARNWIHVSDHQNIVRAISFHRGLPSFLILEYIDGLDLHRLLRGEPSGLSIPQAVEFGIHIARGLSHAHNFVMPGREKGLVHRDLKPSNVLITTGCCAKITDFGLARSRGDTNLTGSSRAIRTYPFMPPEQFEDSHNVTHLADIYSFGMILYVALTGVVPFRGRSAAEIMRRVIETEADPITPYRPECPPQLEDLVNRCMLKMAEDRPESADAVLESLLDIKKTLPSPLVRGIPPCQKCGYRARKVYLRCPVCGVLRDKKQSYDLERCTCGKAIVKGHRFCVYCGRQVSDTVICPNCGSQNSPSHRFCNQCGSSLSSCKPDRAD